MKKKKEKETIQSENEPRVILGIFQWQILWKKHFETENFQGASFFNFFFLFVENKGNRNFGHMF